MRILLADDKAEVRFALRALLETQPGAKVVGEAAEIEALLALARSAGPDLILFDWDLPGREGLDVLAALRADRPALWVIALGRREEMRGAAMAAGADAFVSKADPPQQLLAVIGACARRRAGAD